MKSHHSYPRSDRIADLIKEEVALLFLHKINNPSLKVINVTDVRMSDDLKIAKVYYVCPKNFDKKHIHDDLDGVRGWMRRELSKSLNMRYTPSVEFIYDDVFESGMKIEKILKDINK